MRDPGRLLLLLWTDFVALSPVAPRPDVWCSCLSRPWSAALRRIKPGSSLPKTITVQGWFPGPTASHLVAQAGLWQGWTCEIYGLGEDFYNLEPKCSRLSLSVFLWVILFLPTEPLWLHSLIQTFVDLAPSLWATEWIFFLWNGARQRELCLLVDSKSQELPAYWQTNVWSEYYRDWPCTSRPVYVCTHHLETQWPIRWCCGDPQSLVTSLQLASFHIKTTKTVN